MVFDKDADSMAPEEADDYVPAVYAETVEEAERYCQALEDHDIPAMVDEEACEPDEPEEEAEAEGHIPILVPAELLEDAKSCIDQMGPVAGFDDDDDYDDEDDEDFMLSDKEFPLGAGPEEADVGEEEEEAEDEDDEQEDDDEVEQ